MKLLISLITLILPTVALAAGGHGNEIPKVTIYQFINLVILFSGIIYFTKDSVVALFSARKTAYIESAQKAAAAREQAEKDFAEIKAKLENLDKTREENLQKAKTQAAELITQMNNEANTLANRIKVEAALTAKLEAEKAQKELRTQLLKDSLAAAKIVLSKDLSSADKEKLQNDFINKVGV